MYRLPDRQISDDATKELEDLQSLVDSHGSYDARVVDAKERFDKKPTKLFTKLRAELALMNGDLVRCAYCEDSCADEVEHIRPKDFYPDQVFVWSNYLFSCGPCNGKKNNLYPVFAAGTKIDLRAHRKLNGVVPPPVGQALFVDPRSEDPLDFIWLDISASTFMFSSLNEDDTTSDERAKATIDILRLNREPLRKARENAYGGYVDRLAQYVKRRQDGAPDAELSSRSADISRSPHRTVWLEMKRQAHIIDALRELFEAVPDAHNW